MKRSFIFFLSIGLLLCPQKVVADSDMAIAESLSKFLSKSSSSWQVKQDSDSGVIRQLRRGETSAIDEDSPEKCAMKFISDNPAMFLGADGDIKDITISYVKKSLMGSHVTLKQTWKDLPVFGCEIHVHLNEMNEVFQVDSSAVPIKIKERTPRLDGNDAVEIAKTMLKVKEIGSEPETILGVYPGPPAVNAWKVIFKTDEPHGLWETIVNAQTGKVISKENLLRYNK